MWCISTISAGHMNKVVRQRYRGKHGWRSWRNNASLAINDSLGKEQLLTPCASVCVGGESSVPADWTATVCGYEYCLWSVLVSWKRVFLMFAPGNLASGSSRISPFFLHTQAEQYGASLWDSTPPLPLHATRLVPAPWGHRMAYEWHSPMASSLRGIYIIVQRTAFSSKFHSWKSCDFSILISIQRLNKIPKILCPQFR